MARGLQILRNDINKRARAINNLLGSAAVNQNQFDALMSFAYNLGTGALGSSTLLAKVKRYRNDPCIRNEFARFVKVGGKRLPGLVRRRTAEANLYFSSIHLLVDSFIPTFDWNHEFSKWRVFIACNLYRRFAITLSG